MLAEEEAFATLFGFLDFCRPVTLDRLMVFMWNPLQRFGMIEASGVPPYKHWLSRRELVFRLPSEVQ
jgi:hypothetical protein